MQDRKKHLWIVPRIGWPIFSTFMGRWWNQTIQHNSRIHYFMRWIVRFHKQPINVEKMDQTIRGPIQRRFGPSKFLCVCKLVSGLCDITKLWVSGVPTSTRDHYSIILCRVLLCTYYSASPTYLVANFSTAWGPTPTWASPISVPAYTTAAWVYPPTWESPISIPSHPTPRVYSPAVSP